MKWLLSIKTASEPLYYNLACLDVNDKELYNNTLLVSLHLKQ